jgi:drug/metabolite transporter (DMT)-like permease
MVYLLAIAASFSNALTSVLQRMGVEYAPADHSLRLKLVGHILRQRVWLAGFALMIGSFLLQATALHNGRLAEVQPLLTTELLFLVLILGTRFQFTVGWREWAGAVLAAGGLAGFLVFADPRGGDRVPPTGSWVAVGVACLAAIVVGVVAAQRGPRWWRASAFGMSAAVAFAFTAAFTKVVTGFAATDFVSIFRHWQTYGLAAFGLLAVFLTANAYHAGPIAASQSSLVLLDPLASILIGVTLFGENLRTTGVWGPLEALSLLILFVGAITLCTSPLLNPAKVGGTANAEVLTGRYRSGRGPDAGTAVPGMS